MSGDLPGSFGTELKCLLWRLLCVDLCQHNYYHEDGFELYDFHVYIQRLILNSHVYTKLKSYLIFNKIFIFFYLYHFLNSYNQIFDSLFRMCFYVVTLSMLITFITVDWWFRQVVQLYDVEFFETLWILGWYLVYQVVSLHVHECCVQVWPYMLSIRPKRERI